MPLECGPARHSNGLSCVKGETKDIQDGLSNIIPQLSFEATSVSSHMGAQKWCSVPEQ